MLRTSLFTLSLCLLAAAGNAAEDDEIVVGPVAPNPQEQVQRFGMPNFDQMLFQYDRDPAQADQRLRARADLQLEEIDRACGLSDAQKEQLQLAVRGDLERFRSEAAQLRRKYDRLMKNQNANDMNGFNEVWQQMWQDIQPLHNRMSRGLTSDPASLLMKVLPRTLTTEQLSQFQTVAAERARFRYEAGIVVAFHQLEEAVALTETQREKITQMLLAQPAPRQYGQYDMYVILIRIAELRRETIEPLFGPGQWKSLSRHLDQYRTYRRSLVDSGILDPEDFPEQEVPAKP